MLYTFIYIIFYITYMCLYVCLYMFVYIHMCVFNGERGLQRYKYPGLMSHRVALVQKDLLIN